MVFNLDCKDTLFLEKQWVKYIFSYKINKINFRSNQITNFVVNMKYIITIIICFSTLLSFSQDRDSTASDKEPFSLRDKIYWGGNFGLAFGTNSFVDISPRVGYRITEKLSAGIGLKYQYIGYNDPRSNYKESFSFYGGSIFSRYNLTDKLFLTGEYESLNIKNFWITNFSNWTDFFLVGAGYHHNVGGFTSFYAQVMYDVLENPLLPYFYMTVNQNPPIILRLGLTFGL